MADNQGVPAVGNPTSTNKKDQEACANEPGTHTEPMETAESPQAEQPAEDCQEIIIVNEHTTELDLNHGRIGKIENLEHLKNLERLYLRWNLIKRSKVSAH